MLFDTELSSRMEASLYQGKEIIWLEAQTAFRQSKEQACLVSCFLCSLLHLLLPDPAQVRDSCCSSTVISLMFLLWPLKGLRLWCWFYKCYLSVANLGFVCEGFCFFVCFFIAVDVLDSRPAMCCYFIPSFNRIDIPPYESYEKLYEKLLTAVEETCGFAVEWKSNQRKQMLAHGPPNQKLEEACCDLPAKLSEAPELWTTWRWVVSLPLLVDDGGGRGFCWWFPTLFLLCYNKPFPLLPSPRKWNAAKSSIWLWMHRIFC